MSRFPFFPLAGLLTILAIIPQVMLVAGTTLKIFSKAAPKPTQSTETSSLPYQTLTLAYDPQLWQVATPDPPSFALDPSVGRATVTVTAPAPEALTSLALLTETTTIANLPAQKLTLTETVFGQVLLYHIYTVKHNGQAYAITVKTDGLPPSDQTAASLIENISFSDKVKGLSTASIQAYSPKALSLLTAPSVVNFRYLHCHQVNSPNPQDFPTLPLPFDFCLTGKGSGVVISPEGHIATLGHVVTTFPEQALGQNLPDSALKPFTLGLIKHLSPSSDPESEFKNIQSNPSAARALVKTTYELLDQQSLTVTDQGNKIYINLGKTAFTSRPNQPFLSSVQPADGIFEAEVLDKKAVNFYSLNAVLRNEPTFGQDIALLKISNQEDYTFPAIPIADLQPQPGSFAMIIGFPALVEGAPKGKGILDYATSSVTPTITQGVISAVKTDPTGAVLLQTDASVHSGNSGGPAVNELGQIVGLAALTIPGDSGNYNFLRTIADIKPLLEDNQVSFMENPAYLIWKTGIEAFDKQHYRRALKLFQQAQKIYPLNPALDSVIAESQTAINKNLDQTPLIYIKYSLLQLGVNLWTLVLLTSAATLTCLGLLRHLRRPAIVSVPTSSPTYSPPQK